MTLNKSINDFFGKKQESQIKDMFNNSITSSKIKINSINPIDKNIHLQDNISNNLEEVSPFNNNLINNEIVNENIILINEKEEKEIVENIVSLPSLPSMFMTNKVNRGKLDFNSDYINNKQNDKKMALNVLNFYNIRGAEIKSPHEYKAALKSYFQDASIKKKDHGRRKRIIYIHDSFMNYRSKNII